MKLYDAFWTAWIASFAGLIGATIGIWLNTWYPNPTFEGFLVIIGGFVVMVILLTMLIFIIDHFRKP